MSTSPLQKQAEHDLNHPGPTPRRQAIDAIESDGAQGYLKYLSPDRLADLINETLDEETRRIVEAHMIDELTEHLGGDE